MEAEERSIIFEESMLFQKLMLKHKCSLRYRIRGDKSDLIKALQFVNNKLYFISLNDNLLLNFGTFVYVGLGAGVGWRYFKSRGFQSYS